MLLNKLIKLSCSLFDFLYDGVAIVDKDGTTIYVVV
jgi:hypothetical protein